MAPSPTPAQLLDAYTNATGQLRDAVLRVVENAWAELSSWREADIEAFVRQVTPVVAAGQRKTAAFTDAYLSQMEALATGKAVRPLGIPADVVSSATMRGVPVEDVYRRLGPEVWTELANGRTLDQAVRSAGARATGMARTDLQLAKTHATRYALERSGNATGYLRAPDGDACELCLLASEQVYSTDELMPIHERCACDVEPLFGDTDRSASPEPDVTNPDDVEIDVEDHGELGPVLVVKGQQFTGPDDI